MFETGHKIRWISDVKWKLEMKDLEDSPKMWEKEWETAQILDGILKRTQLPEEIQGVAAEWLEKENTWKNIRETVRKKQKDVNQISLLHVSMPNHDISGHNQNIVKKRSGIMNEEKISRIIAENAAWEMAWKVHKAGQKPPVY